MGKDMYEAIKPEQKTKKVKAPRKPMNKDSLIIGIVVAVIILLTAGIVAYYFWGVNSEVLVKYEGGEITRGEYEAIYRYWAPQLSYYGYETSDIDDIIVDDVTCNNICLVLYKLRSAFSPSATIIACFKSSVVVLSSISAKYADTTALL